MEMNGEIEEKVMDWIYRKIREGITIFEVEKCTKEIGMNPNNNDDLKKVDNVFQ